MTPTMDAQATIAQAAEGTLSAIATQTAGRQAALTEVVRTIEAGWTATPTLTRTPSPTTTRTPAPTETLTPTETASRPVLVAPGDGEWFSSEGQSPLLKWNASFTRLLPDNVFYRIQVYHTFDQIVCNLYTKNTFYALPPARTEPCNPETWKFNTGGYNWRVSVVIRQDNEMGHDMEVLNSEGRMFYWHQP